MVVTHNPTELYRVQGRIAPCCIAPSAISITEEAGVTDSDNKFLVEEVYLGW